MNLNGPLIRFNDRRAAWAMQAVGRNLMPVVFDQPVDKDLEGAGIQPCFILDTGRLTMMELCGVYDELAARRGCHRIDVIKQMREFGCIPIVAKGCDVVSAAELEAMR